MIAQQNLVDYMRNLTGGGTTIPSDKKKIKKEPVVPEKEGLGLSSQDEEEEPLIYKKAAPAPVKKSNLLKKKITKQIEKSKNNGNVSYEITDISLPILIDDNTRRRFGCKVSYKDTEGHEKKRIIKFGRKGKPEKNPLNPQFYDNVLSFVLANQFNKIFPSFKETVLDAQHNL